VDSSLFSRKAFDALPEGERVNRLRELQVEMASRIAFITDRSTFFQACYRTIDELKELGHDIWRWDFDDDYEIWGGDYMRPDIAGRLHLSFRLNEEPRIEVTWRTVD